MCKRLYTHTHTRAPTHTQTHIHIYSNRTFNWNGWRSPCGFYNLLLYSSVWHIFFEFRKYLLNSLSHNAYEKRPELSGVQHFYGIWKEVWDLEATLTGARWFLTVDSAPKFPSPLPSPSKNVHNADVKVRRDFRVSGPTGNMQRKLLSVGKDFWEYWESHRGTKFLRFTVFYCRTDCPPTAVFWTPSMCKTWL